jgi:hypothetical protein
VKHILEISTNEELESRKRESAETLDLHKRFEHSEAGHSQPLAE